MRSGNFLLPNELLEKITVGYLNYRDIQAMAGTSRAVHRFFGSSQMTWRSLLRRDFNISHDDTDCPRNLYREIYFERQRMVRYAQAFIISKTKQLQLTPIEIFSRYRDLSRQNPYDPLVPLLSAIKCKQYSLFMERTAEVLTHESGELIAQRGDMLLRLYSALFLASGAEISAILNDMMPTIKAVCVNREAIDFTSQEGMIILMLSLLGKCDAPHTLNMLMGKLEENGVTQQSKYKLLKYCGASLCRDAAAMGNHEMVYTLLKRFDNTNLVGVSPNAVANYSVLFNETELLPLPAAMQSLHELCMSREYLMLDQALRKELVNNYAEAIFMLCFYGADRNLSRVEYSLNLMDNVTAMDGSTICEYASRLRDEIQPIIGKLEIGERSHIIKTYNKMLGVDEDEQLDELFDEVDVQSPSRKQAREDDLFDEAEEENPSPKKKGKTAVSDDENIEWVHSPRAEESVTSPVRHILGKMNLNYRF